MMGSRRFSRGAVVDGVVYAVGITLFLLFFGRFLGLPFFLAAIVSPSMEPAIRVGDVVAVQRGAPFGVGDVIMWCSTPFYCVVHRVVEVGQSYVVTKGDANPVPDLPVAITSVAGRVVAVVPREALLAAVLILVCAELWRRRRSLIRPSDPVSFMAYGLVSFLALAMVTLLFFPAPSVFEVGEFKVPSITMLSVTYDNGTVTLRYRPVYTGITGVPYCAIGAPGMASVRCTPAAFSGDTVLVSPPPSMLAELNERGVSRFWVSLVCSLRGNGTLKGNYSVVFSASRLLVRVTNESLIIRNPNPFPVPYNLTILYSEGGGRGENVSSGYVGPLESLVVGAGGYSSVWYRLRYTYMGGVTEVAGWVHRG